MLWFPKDKQYKNRFVTLQFKTMPTSKSNVPLSQSIHASVCIYVCKGVVYTILHPPSPFKCHFYELIFKVILKGLAISPPTEGESVYFNNASGFPF